jgi:hypothetical protein
MMEAASDGLVAAMAWIEDGRALKRAREAEALSLCISNCENNCYQHNLRVNSTLLDRRDSCANEGKDGNGELHFDCVCKNGRLAKVMVLKVDSGVDSKNYGTECKFKEEYGRERMPGKSIAHIYASTKSLKGAEELNWTLHLSGRALTQGRRSIYRDAPPALWLDKRMRWLKLGKNDRPQTTFGKALNFHTFESLNEEPCFWWILL